MTAISLNEGLPRAREQQLLDVFWPARSRTSDFRLFFEGGYRDTQQSLTQAVLSIHQITELQSMAVIGPASISPTHEDLQNIINVLQEQMKLEDKRVQSLKIAKNAH
jgi:hypothetical protein